VTAGESTSESQLASRRAAACELAAEAGAALLVAADPATIYWLTGGRQARCLVVAPGGARAVEAGELADALHDAGVGPADLVAVEAAALPVSLGSELSRRPTTDVSASLLRARARKDRAEVERLRRAAAVASAGQQAVRAAASPGISEIDLWSAAIASMQRLAGAPVHAIVDLMAGERTGLVGAPPGARLVEGDELVLVDIAPQVEDYWGDSCAAFCAGRPAVDQRRMHDACARALDRGIAAARPGAVAHDVDAVVRGAMAESGYSYDHHSGHGVGLAAQEEPWITPSSDIVLEEGMVVALEPGTYTDGLGARLEHLVLVRADGPDVLTTHSLSLTREESPDEDHRD
jgi:Xaa-Pro dipeptidase